MELKPSKGNWQNHPKKNYAKDSDPEKWKEDKAKFPMCVKTALLFYIPYYYGWY